MNNVLLGPNKHKGDVGRVGPPPPIVRYCYCRNSGCPEAFPVDDDLGGDLSMIEWPPRTAHEGVCPRRPVTCEACNKKGLIASDLPAHALICPNRPAPCPWECGAMITYAELGSKSAHTHLSKWERKVQVGMWLVDEKTFQPKGEIAAMMY